LYTIGCCDNDEFGEDRAAKEEEPGKDNCRKLHSFEMDGYRLKRENLKSIVEKSGLLDDKGEL